MVMPRNGCCMPGDLMVVMRRGGCMPRGGGGCMISRQADECSAGEERPCRLVHVRERANAHTALVGAGLEEANLWRMVCSAQRRGAGERKSST